MIHVDIYISIILNIFLYIDTKLNEKLKLLMFTCSKVVNYKSLKVVDMRRERERE